jgi:hypothetical protein
MNELSKASEKVTEELVRELDAEEVKAVAGGPGLWV